MARKPSTTTEPNPTGLREYVTKSTGYRAILVGRFWLGSEGRMSKTLDMPGLAAYLKLRPDRLEYVTTDEQRTTVVMRYFTDTREHGDFAEIYDAEIWRIEYEHGSRVRPSDERIMVTAERKVSHLIHELSDKAQQILDGALAGPDVN